MNHIRNKKHILFFLTFLFVLCTGCSSSPIPRTKMDRYVNETFGPAQFLKEERDTKAIIYFYKDNEFNFEYWVKSYSSGFTIVGLTFFHFEDKDTNFPGKYYECISKQLREDLYELEGKYAIKIETIETERNGSVDTHNGLFKVILPSDASSSPEEISYIIASLCKEKDKRNFFKEGHIHMLNHEDELYGYYDLALEKYVSAKEADIERFQIIACQKDKSSKYEYSETISIHEFLQKTGILLEDLQEKDRTEVTLYYFRTNSGKIYFMADVIYHGDLYSDFN